MRPLAPSLLDLSDDCRALNRDLLDQALLEIARYRTGADELIVTTYAFDPAVRDRSLQLLAEAWF